MKTPDTSKTKPVASESLVVNHLLLTNNDRSKTEVNMALYTLDTIYKNNISSYADIIYEYTRQIDNVQSQIADFYKEIKPHKTTLLEVEKEIDYALRTLERFTQEWNQIILVIEALKEELTQLNHSIEEQRIVLKSRTKSLKQLEKEIEDMELILLEHALEKQNILIHIEPTEREIRVLELYLKQLDSQKRYVESSYLHQISPSGQSNT